MENETKLTEQILLEAKNKWMDRALLAEEKLKEFQEMSEFCGDGHIKVRYRGNGSGCPVCFWMQANRRIPEEIQTPPDTPTGDVRNSLVQIATGRSESSRDRIDAAGLYLESIGVISPGGVRNGN